MTEPLLRFGALLAADLRQRTRSQMFWVVLALSVGLTWLCFPPVTAKYIIVGVNGNHRGAYSSAWIGMVLAMLSIWTSLAGFQLLRGSVRRDFETRVWELLEATPLSRAAYLLSKWCSHMLALAMLLVPQVLVGLLAQVWRGEDSDIAIGQMLAPVLLFAVPSLAVTAMLAIWFDMIPPLRGSAGYILYLFISGASIAAAVQAPAGHHWFSDPRGITLFHEALHVNLDGVLAAPLKACIGCGFAGRGAMLFDWPGWSLAPEQVGGRILWLAVSIGVVLLAAPLLDRIAAGSRKAEQRAAGHGTPRAARWLANVLQPLRRTHAGALLAAELQLSLQGRPPMWWLGVVAAWVFQSSPGGPWAPYGVIGAWLLLAPVYGQAPLRETRHGADAIMFSAPHGARRIFFGRWAMLLLLGWLWTLPAMVQYGVHAPLTALAVLVAGGSLASWSMALAALTRSSRPMEILLCGFAYFGLQGMAVLNVAADAAWTVMLHVALLPGAGIAYLLSWPRLMLAA
jgi:hypothetical protein